MVAANGNALLRAVIKDDGEEVKKLLASGEHQVDVKDQDGFTPLHKACMKGNPDLVRLLLDKGADVKAKCHGGTYPGSSPLFMASMCNSRRDIIDLLISKGAEVDAKRTDGGTLLHACASGGHLETVKFCVELKRMDVNARRSDGTTVLLDAVQHSGNKAVIEYLLTKGADVSAVDDAGANALHKSVFGGQIAMLDFLLLKGVKMRVPGSPPLLHYAAMGGHKESVEWLIGKKMDVNEKDKEGMTALMHACKESGNIEVQELLESKAADINAVTEQGYSALHFAIEYDLIESVKFLVQKCAKLNAKAKDGTTPLFLALQNPEVTELLVKKGADIKAALGDGATLLHAAAEGGSLEVVKFYVSQGIDINIRDSYGRTPLMYACELKGSMETIKFLVSRGADVHLVTNDGATLLHLSVLGERVDVVDYLVKTQGMDVNIRRPGSGYTPLMTAAANVGKMEFIKALTLKGADTKLCAGNGSSLVQIAALGGQLELVKALVSDGHDLQYQRPDGVTVLHAASFGGSVKLIKYLLAEDCNVGEEKLRMHISYGAILVRNLKNSARPTHYTL